MFVTLDQLPQTISIKIPHDQDERNKRVGNSFWGQGSVSNAPSGKDKVGQLATKLQKQNMKMWIEDKYSPSDLNEIIAPYDMELKTQVPLWSEYLPFLLRVTGTIRTSR